MFVETLRWMSDHTRDRLRRQQLEQDLIARGFDPDEAAERAAAAERARLERLQP